MKGKKPCPGCHADIPSATGTCRACGYQFFKAKKPQVQRMKQEPPKTLSQSPVHSSAAAGVAGTDNSSLPQTSDAPQGDGAGEASRNRSTVGTDASKPSWQEDLGAIVLGSKVLIPFTLTNGHTKEVPFEGKVARLGVVSNGADCPARAVLN